MEHNLSGILCLGFCASYVNIYKENNLMQSSSMFIGNCKIALLHVSAAFCVHLQEH